MQSDQFRSLLERWIVDWEVYEKQSVMHVNGLLKVRGAHVQVNLKGQREAVQDVLEGLVKALVAGERLSRA